MPTSSLQTSEQRSSTPRDTSLVPVPQRLRIWLALGVLGTVLFPVIYVIEGATRPGYDAWQQTISALSFGSAGWIQRANFLLCGLSVLWLALVWRLILKGGVSGRGYPVVHALEGIGLIGVGVFIQDPLHTAWLIVIVAAMSVGLFVIARRFWFTPGWRGWAWFSVACGLWPMLVMPFFGMGLNPHSPFSPYAGFFERLATSADIVWGAVILIPVWMGHAFMQAEA